jgi:O-antigen/teichoic acid export membrane protein
LKPDAPDDPGTSRAVAWTLAARQGERLIGIVSISILARLLSPSDFGLVAMAGSIAALVEVLSAFGFDWALVRLPHPTREHYDTAWTLRVACGLGVCCTLIVLARPVASLYARPAVAAIVVAMGINSLIGSLENIWMAEFRRQNRFDQEFKLRLLAKVAGFLTATTWALLLHSYWALVAGVTASRLTATALSYWIHPLRPRWDLSRRADLLQFSAWLLLGNVTDVLRVRFSEVWLGRNLGPRPVGLYSMASELSALATTEWAAPINRAVFTRYMRDVGDIDALRDGYLRVSGLIWAVGMPAAVGIGLCAPLIVMILLGGQWTDASRVLQILAVAGLLNIMASNTQYVYWAFGKSRFVTLLSLVGATAFVVLTLLFGRRFGVTGVAWAQVIASAIVLIVNYAVLLRTLRLRMALVVRRSYRVVLASAAMAVLIIAVTDASSSWPLHQVWQRLALMIVIGVASYFAILTSLWVVLGKPAGPEADLRDAFRAVGTRCLDFLQAAYQGRA